MRLVCRALPADRIVFRSGTSVITKETPLDVGDETVADFDDGARIILCRSIEHYRVSARDRNGEREGREFDNEPDARDHAKRLFVAYYPGGVIRTALRRHGQTVTYVRTPPKEALCP